MKKISSILIVILFFIWILPLGVFIKPEQEKKTCNGRRAICLCSHLIKKQIAKLAGKQFLKSGGGAHKQENSSSSSGPDYITSNKIHSFQFHKNQYYQTASIFLNQLFTRPIEHIPKI